MSVLEIADAAFFDLTTDRAANVSFLEGALKDSSDDPQILWRLARATYDLGLLETTPLETKRSLAFERVTMTTKALELAPDDPNVLKWAAIALSATNEFENAKTKLINVVRIRSLFQRACDVGGDALCHHLLGRCCYQLADMTWMQRTAARALVSEVPTSTYEEALRHFEACESKEPKTHKNNAFYMSQTLIKLKRKKEAKEWIQICILMPNTKGVTDEQLHAQALALDKQL
ncbi:hypothetical protein LEN26_012328 [Aphanomyces euteiches]|nr:hypothetical protein LEN26_012328 [Aphanomyces euteiches]